MSIRLYPLLMCAALLCACNAPEAVPAGEPAMASITLQFGSRTKSALTGPALPDALTEVTVYGVETGGYWQRAYTSLSDTQEELSLRFRAGAQVTFFVLGNMGDVTLPLAESGIPAFEEYVYRIPSIEDLRTRGFPMAAQVGIVNVTGATQLAVSLQPLVAAVHLSVDKTGLTGGSSAPVLDSRSLRICQANRRLCPFNPVESRALEAGDIFPEPFDFHLLAHDYTTNAPTTRIPSSQRHQERHPHLHAPQRPKITLD